LGAFSSTAGVHLHGAAHQQRVGFRQVLGVFLGIGNDDVPAGLGLNSSIPAGSEGLGDENIHGKFDYAFTV
jgi:hypothetical protein